MNAGVIGIAQQYGLSPDQTNIISNSLNELHALCKNLHAELYYDVSTNSITHINKISFNILFKTGFRMIFQNELPNYSVQVTTNALLIMVANIRDVIIRLDRSLRVIYSAIKEYRNDNSIIDTPYHICAYIECIIKGSEEKLTSGQLARRWEDALINSGWKSHFDSIPSTRFDSRIGHIGAYIREFEIIEHLLKLDFLKIVI